MQTEAPSNTGTAQVYTANIQREPPPYPGLARGLYQPGLRQSYSGSEASTDYSLSSCENLSTSIRQEPQGEENAAVTSSPQPEGGTDSSKLYRDMLSRLGLAQAPSPGAEIKPSYSPTFYVTGNNNNNMSSPVTTTMCTGVHDNQVNTSESYVGALDNAVRQNANNNNNNVKCYPSRTGPLANQNLNNNVLVANRSPQVQTRAPPAYQEPGGPSVYAVAASPSTSPTPLVGTSPAPNGQSSSNPGTPSTPGSLSAPGTPNITHHKCVPHMGCAAIGTSPIQNGQATLPNRPPQSLVSRAAESKTCSASAVVTGSAGLERKAVARSSPQVPSSLHSQSWRFNEPMLSSSDESPTQEVTQSLAQIMTALSRQTTASSQPGHRNLKKQRPSTAPAMRHLPTAPPPPDYPGYPSRQNEVLTPLKKEAPPYVWSQPDLTHLGEVQGAQQQQVKQQEHHMPTSELGHPQPPLTPSIEHGANHGYSGSGISVMSCQATSDAIQALSTSSSTSSLMQYHQQNLHFQPNLDPEGQLFQGGTSSSPVSCLDPALLDPNLMDPSLLDPNFVDMTFGGHGQLLGPNGVMDRQMPASQSHAAVATRATKMVERLSEENCFLRQELEGFANKVYRLQKLESEIQKVHENYETLEKHSQKQENLEKLIRYKLVKEIKQLRETNKELKDHLDKSLRQLQQKEVYSLMDSDIKKELLGKDSLIARLITQNRDLTVAKEHLEAEVSTQKSTMHEQRAHISMLDGALSTARSELRSNEEQIQKRNAEDDKISELQKALSQLQTAVERREAIEQKLRQKLEEEVQYLRRQGVSKVTETDEGIASDSESPTSLQSLVRQMQEKEQRLLALEAEAAKWKQKYLEELAMRQFAVDAASVPKDARIAVLEQNSVETEKMIAEARTERLQHLDEVHVTNRKCAELESKLKTMQAQLAEKDAMIRVLQRHTPHSHNSSLGSLLGSPVHSPKPSCISPLCSPQTSPMSSHNVSAVHSGASSRQNSQLDGQFIDEASGGKAENEREGNSLTITKSNSPSASTTVRSNNSSPINESQLRELQQRLTAQAALFGSLPSNPDQLKKYMWQV